MAALPWFPSVNLCISVAELLVGLTQIWDVVVPGSAEMGTAPAFVDSGF